MDSISDIDMKLRNLSLDISQDIGNDLMLVFYKMLIKLTLSESGIPIDEWVSQLLPEKFPYETRTRGCRVFYQSSGS